MGQVEALEVARKARSLTGDYCAMVTGRKLERVRLGEFLLRWQNDAAGQVKPPALVKYQQIVREFLAATRAQETGLLLEDVTAEHISHFFEQKRAKASVTKAYV